jgi:Ca2+-binding EF-hand superfamily protein
VLESGGWDYNEDELNYLIKKMDKNKSGKIDLN